jgi:hypothetical protein
VTPISRKNRSIFIIVRCPTVHPLLALHQFIKNEITKGLISNFYSEIAIIGAGLFNTSGESFEIDDKSFPGTSGV